MMTARNLRNVAFGLMLGTFMAALQGSLAADPGDVCWNYRDECTCDFDPYSWNWQMSCDFSENEDPQGAGAEFCNAAAWECMEWCGAPYESHVIQECYWTNPWAPEVCNADCFFTWDSFNCGAGETSEMSCSCNSFNWCVP